MRVVNPPPKAAIALQRTAADTPALFDHHLGHDRHGSSHRITDGRVLLRPLNEFPDLFGVKLADVRVMGRKLAGGTQFELIELNR